MNKHKKYWHKYIGFNYRMTNMQYWIRAIGKVQLLLEAKIKIANLYKKI